MRNSTLRNAAAVIGFFALVAITSAFDINESYKSNLFPTSILRKPKYAGGGDGAARGKIVNGFAIRPSVSHK